MKCKRCGAELDETKRVVVPAPDWIDVYALPCYECETVTIEVPSMDIAEFRMWARKHFGFDGA